MRTGSHQRLCIEAGIALGLFVAPMCGQYTISTVAGSGSLASCSSPEIGDGGPATAALLCSPYGVAVDSGGSLYIADTNHHRIRKVTLDGIISTVAGNGSAGDCSGDGGPATSTTLAAPVGIAVDGGGNLYIANGLNVPACGGGGWPIRKVTPGGTISTVISWLYTPACSTPQYCNGLHSPGGMAVDGAGNLFVADSGHNWILKGPSSGFIPVSTWPLPWVVAGDAVTASAGYAGDGGPAVGALLANPTRVAVDGAGNFFVADLSNHRIRKVTPGGIISTVAGNGVAGYSGDGGLATAASINRAWDVALDGAGNLYIADTDNHRIRKVTPDGIISTIAGNGVAGYSGDGGPATSASLYGPMGVAVDGAGRVFIAEPGSNNRVRMLTPEGPAAPSNVDAVVRVNVNKRSTVYTGTVTWRDNSNNETGFLIRRFSNASGACVVEAGYSSTVAANTTAYTDGAADATTCGYGVASANGGGTSAYVDDTNVVSTPPPSPPGNVNAVMTTSTKGKHLVYSATISWLNTSANATDFLVRRYLTSGSSCVIDTDFGTAVLPANKSSYTDSQAPAATCAYAVAAANSGGISAYTGDRDLSAGITPF